MSDSFRYAVFKERRLGEAGQGTADAYRLAEEVRARFGAPAGAVQYESEHDNDAIDAFYDMWRDRRFADFTKADLDVAVEFMVVVGIEGDEAIAYAANKHKLLTLEELTEDVHANIQADVRAHDLDDLRPHIEAHLDEMSWSLAQDAPSANFDDIWTKCEAAEEFEGDFLGNAWREARAYVDQFGVNGPSYESNLALHADFVIRRAQQVARQRAWEARR